MNRLSSAVVLGMLLVVTGCGKKQEAAIPPLPKLDTFTVSVDDKEGGRAWDGVVEAVQAADLSAQTTGRVAEIGVDVNDVVSAGQVLLRLTAVEQQAGAEAARAQLRSAEAAAREATANYDRYAALGEKQYVSRLQFDQAKAARDAAIAARDAARAQLAQAAQHADYTVVRAPFAGIISARNVEPGESIMPGQSLLSLYAPGALRIELYVPQDDAQSIRAAGRAKVHFGEGRSVDAAAVTVFPAADPDTHSVTVRVMLPDLQQALRPGVTAKVLFPIGAGAGAPMIPSSAIVQRGELSAVYVLADGRLFMRQLRLGRASGDRTEVLAGLKPGDVVASNPVAAVQALVAQREAAGGQGE